MQLYAVNFIPLLGLESLLNSFGLEGIVDFPTRITPDSQTLIDNIFLEKKSLKTLIYPHINGISDHDGQLVILPELNTPLSKTPIYCRRVINEQAVQKFVTTLSHECWEVVFSNEDINTIFNSFLDSYLKIYHSCFPTKNKRNSSNSKPWLTKGLKISCHNKNRLYQLSKHSTDCGFISYFKRYRKILKSTIESSKRKYHDNLIQNSVNKTKTTWNIVKALTNKRRNNNTITSLNIKNKIVEDPITIAHSFNTFFSNIAQTYSYDSLDKDSNRKFHRDNIPNISEHITSFYFKPTSTSEITKIIKALKVKDSYGYDEISSRILKISAPYIVSPLTYIFNQIFRVGKFPDRMKFSIVRPLHKKGSTKELANYRPISLLTTFSKVLEKLMYIRLYSYLEEHKILSKDQFGFRESLSTCSATFALINSILLAFEKNNLVGGLFCDIHKAFDCVNHEILLTKLEYHGVSNTSNKLIRSYLNDRYQRVQITNNLNIKANSSWEHIKHGVPQGSVLGPLLFLVYINDLAVILRKHATPILFADDTSVIITSPDSTEFKTKINQVTNDIASWCKANFLTLNLEKTQFMQFVIKHQKQMDTHVTVSETVIPETTSIKFLGLLIDNKLTWKPYGRELAIKLNRACYIMRILKPMMSRESLITIYHSYFHSILRYGILFWGNTPISKDIFKIQKRIVRIIIDKNRRESCRELFKNLKILTLTSQYIMYVLFFCH